MKWVNIPNGGLMDWVRSVCFVYVLCTILGVKIRYYVEQGKALSVLSSGISMLFEYILHFLVYRL